MMTRCCVRELRLHPKLKQSWETAADAVAVTVLVTDL